jgi:membrane protease YdiL (CAAX protease family)
MPWDFWLILFILAVVLPWRGRQRMRALMLQPEVSGRERIRLYVSTILFQWTLTALIAWRAHARGLNAEELGLVFGSLLVVPAVTFAGALVIAVGHWKNIRRMARSNHPAAQRLRALAVRIFPRTPREAILYIALALTAGICEEFIFRGFLLAAFTRAGLSSSMVVLATAAIFGLAHLYQGRGGSLGTGILGVLFAIARIAYTSLLPVAVWHAVLDIVAGVAGGRYLVAEISTAEPLRTRGND